MEAQTKVKDITVLMKYSQKEYDIVCPDEIEYGDMFTVTSQGMSNTYEVVEIQEQRKEKGKHKDESRRRQWAKVIAKVKASNPIVNK